MKKTAEARENARYDELKKIAADTALAAPEGKAAAAMGLEDKIISAAENRVKKPEWYILDRESNVSFVSLKANAEKVNSIAKVFPVFFFAVAALVALTTMTRMVDEERTEIGTLKALGFAPLPRNTCFTRALRRLRAGFSGWRWGFTFSPRLL